MFIRSRLIHRAISRHVCAIVALLPLISAPASAQTRPLPRLSGVGADLDGVWEGMFQEGGDAMSVAFTIATVQDKTTISVDILEQHAQDIPVNAAAVNGQQVHFDVAALDGVFEGAFSPDHSAIQGTWVQLGKRIPLTVKRRASGTAP